MWGVKQNESSSFYSGLVVRIADIYCNAPETWKFVNLVYKNGTEVSEFIFICPHENVPYMQFEIPSEIRLETIDRKSMEMNLQFTVNNLALFGSVEKGSIYIDRTPVASLAFDTAFGDTSNEIEFKFPKYGEVLIFEKVDRTSPYTHQRIAEKKGAVTDFEGMIDGCERFRNSP